MPPMKAAPSRTVPLIIATALFMENLDATVLSTALPTIARDFGVNPIHLKLALTSYLLSLAIFIPASGWMADRFGAKTVFRAAMAVFILGSVSCGLSNDLTTLVLARVLQGIGGAMMTPVGRLVVLRSTPREGLVGAMAWLTMPALLGPVLGPPVGGFFTTFLDWRWIFWINVPIAALGIILATLYIPDIREERPAPFDLAGFALVGPGLMAFLTGATLTGLAIAPPWLVVSLLVAGIVLLAFYVRHALHHPAPLLDLRLLKLPTYRISVTAGLLFRIGVGATPFLLPLLLQEALGYSPFEAGLLTLATGGGAIIMKPLAQRILTRFGFRRILVVNAVIAGLLVGAPAFFGPATPWPLIVVILLVGGFFRSLQFTAMNAIAYADMPTGLMSRATSFSAVAQELSGSIGVTVAALGLEAAHAWLGGPSLSLGHFPPVYAIIALLAIASSLILARLPTTAGTELLPGRKRG